MTIGRPNSSNNNGKVSIMNRIAMFETSNGDTTAAAQNDSNGSNNIKASAERETEDARNSRKSRHNRSDMGTSGSMERTPSTSTAATVKSLSSRSSDGRGSAANENEIKRNTGDDEGRIRARSRSSSRDGRRSAGTINAPAAPVAFGGDSSDDEPGQIMSAASASSMEPRKVVVGNYSGIRRGSKASMWEDALKNGHSAPPDINMESTNQGVVRVEEAEAKRVHEDANNVAAPSAKTFVKRGTKASMWEEKVHKQRNPADDSVSQSTKDIPVEGQKNMHARTTRSPSYSPKILAKRGSKALMWEERSKGGEASKDERVEGVSGTGGGEPPSTPPRALKDYGKGKHQSHVPQSPSSTWRQRLEERNNIGVDASSQHHDLNNEIVKEKQIFTTEFKQKESFENIDNNAFLFEDDKVAEGLREEILMDANEISENYEHEHSISRLDRTHESTMSSKWSEPTNDPSVSYLNLSETEEFLPGPSNGHSISVMESTNADDDFSSSFNGDHFVASTKPSTVSLSNSEAGGYKQNGGVRGKSPFQPIFDGQSDFVAGKGDFTSLSAKDQSIPGYSNVDGSDWIEDTPIIDAKPNTDEPSIGEIGEDAPPIPNRGRKSRSEKMKRFNSMKNNRQMINGKGASPIDAAIVVNEQSQPLPQHDAIKPIRSTPSRRSRLDKLRSPSPAMRRTSQSPSPVVSMRDNQAIGYDNELGANLDSTPVKSSKRERAISARRERSRTPTRYVGSKEVFSTPKKGEQEHVEVVTPDGTNSGRYTPSRSVSRSEKLKKTKALLNSQRTKGANSPVVAKEQRNNDIDRLDDGHIFSADRNNGFTVAEMEHRAAQREREETEHRLATQAAEMERLAEVRDIQPNNYQYESSKIESADKDVYSRGGNDLEGDVTYKDNLLPADVPPPPPTIPPPHPSPPKYTSVAYLMESSEGEQFNYSFESHHSVEKNREVDDAVQENLPSRRHEKSIDEVQVNIPLQAATLTSPSPNISQNSISPVDITMLASGKGLVKAQSPAIAWGDVNGNASQVQKRYPVKIESLPEKDLSESVERRNSPKLEISSGKKSATKSKLHDDFSIVSSTVSGNDALSTWWQSTYAATQDPEINSAVEHALAPGQAVDDDEDVFSGIDAPDDEVDGDSIGPSSHSSIDGVGGEVKESGRRPKLGILSSKTKFQDDVNRLELVREVSDEEYEDSSLHMQRKSKLSMKEKNAGKSASSKSTNLKKKKSVESGKQGKRDSSSPVTVPTAETPLDDGSDGSGSYYEDEEDYTYDESVKANRTYDLENPTIPVEWEQDHKGSGLDNQAQSKIRFSFAAIGCNVLDTVKEACVVPTEREKICKFLVITSYLLSKYFLSTTLSHFYLNIFRCESQRQKNPVAFFTQFAVNFY